MLARGRKLADKLNEKLSAVILGSNIDNESLKELILRGADRIYFAEASIFEHFLVEPYSNVLEHIIKKYRPDIFIAGATTL
ncbi:TPA: electron transfer flavoprotein subunit alpha, partial [bacterium]|nr:electron transfer flavoprotein subunit alpha [bacterium]